MFAGSRHVPHSILRLSRGSLVLLLGLGACGGGQKEPRSSLALSDKDDPSSDLAAPPIETVQAPLTHVERAEVDEAIAEGVGRFIQGFDMIEELDEYDRFVGWKIGKIHDRARFEGLGIGTGDVVTSINGLPLERPAHAYEAMMSLKTAQSIDVEYLRGGRVMRLSLPIIGAPSVASPAKKPDEEPKAPEAAPSTPESKVTAPAPKKKTDKTKADD